MSELDRTLRRFARAITDAPDLSTAMERAAEAQRRQRAFEERLDAHRCELVLLSDEALRERALVSAIRDEVPRAQLIEIVASHEVGHELMVGGWW